MAEPVREFYDELAPVYHLIFEDWEGSMARQAAALGPILERECGPAASARILDCTCGIGTQVLGLAKLGFQVTGTDVSAGAIERARAEAASRGLELSLHVASVLHLAGVPAGDFDAVISMDNALPHLSSDEELAIAAEQVRKKLRPGGVFIASIRDYDRLIEERPVVEGPRFLSDEGRRRIVFQMWDWIDQRRYAFHLYITRETAGGWTTDHGVSTYRAVRRNELTRILAEADFVGVRWMMPSETGFYQPIVIGKAKA